MHEPTHLRTHALYTTEAKRLAAYYMRDWYVVEDTPTGATRQSRQARGRPTALLSLSNAFVDIGAGPRRACPKGTRTFTERPKQAIYWPYLSSHGRSARINSAGVFVTPMPKECREKTTRSHLRVANRQCSSASLPLNASN
jgi:hypothetical protein